LIAPSSEGAILSGGAEPENEHRDHEAPEIEFPAMPERVLGRGFSPAQLHSSQQRHAIAGIHR